jgi:hypothetical protein
VNPVAQRSCSGQPFRNLNQYVEAQVHGPVHWQATWMRSSSIHAFGARQRRSTSRSFAESIRSSCNGIMASACELKTYPVTSAAPRCHR